MVGGPWLLGTGRGEPGWHQAGSRYSFPLAVGRWGWRDLLWPHTGTIGLLTPPPESGIISFDRPRSRRRKTYGDANGVWAPLKRLQTPRIRIACP